MPILSAENHFRKGLVALVAGDHAQANSQFHSAILIELQRGVSHPQMRYLSYYGLTLALLHGGKAEAIRACETAARRDFFNPDLQFNLGKVYMISGKTTRALSAFERGLHLAPNHRGLQAEMMKVDRRRRPPLPWLGRAHPLNRYFGKLRASLFGQRPRWNLPRRTISTT